MARSDLLKRLFRAHQRDDRAGFLDAAREVVDDERRKQHGVLARELAQILEGVSASTGIPSLRLEQVPKDNERGTELVEVLQPQRFLEDLVLNARQLGTLNSVCEQYQQWDVLAANGKRQTANGLRASTRLLFCGPPGCGKTATAEAIASRVGLPLLYVRFDSVVSSLLGETAANLRKVFEFAAKGSWVVLFDEFDAVGRSRDDATEHGELKRVVNSFLQMLDRFTGRSILIAATNFEQSLDPALWRRFDEVLRFEKPTLVEVERLVRLRCASWLPKNAALETVIRGLEGSSHAEVERVCLDTVKRAVLEGKRVLLAEHWDWAIDRHRQRDQIVESLRTDQMPHVDRD